MNKLFICVVLYSWILTGCAKSEPETSFKTIATFPVNKVCHNYVSSIKNEAEMFEIKLNSFTVKLDAFPQIFGFMELRSNKLLSVDLQNEAIKIMDKCFARAKTSIPIPTLDSWIEVGRAVQSNKASNVPIHALIINGTEIDIYYNWDDKSN
ncbi:MAG: hypothetical protein ACI9IA_001403 [Enterobacterales bacterium]|jgi:hypothetical protein